MLAIGTAAFRDAASFFSYETQDDFGTPNPVAKQFAGSSLAGSSQSGTFIRALIHYGFTQDEANRQVYDGAWPIIAAPANRLEFPLCQARPRDEALRGRQRRPASGGTSFPIRSAACRTGGILDRCERQQNVSRRSSSISVRLRSGV